MHFAIRFLTEYRYDAAVTDNLNALRVRPATTSSQRCDEFHTRIEPEARVSRHLDYFGTEVIEFGISQPAVSQHLRVLRENGFVLPYSRIGRAGFAAIYRTRTASASGA